MLYELLLLLACIFHPECTERTVWNSLGMTLQFLEFSKISRVAGSLQLLFNQTDLLGFSTNSFDAAYRVDHLLFDQVLNKRSHVNGSRA